MRRLLLMALIILAWTVAASATTVYTYTGNVYTDWKIDEEHYTADTPSQYRNHPLPQPYGYPQQLTITITMPGDINLANNILSFIPGTITATDGSEAPPHLCENLGYKNSFGDLTAVFGDFDAEGLPGTWYLKLFEYEYVDGKILPGYPGDSSTELSLTIVTTNTGDSSLQGFSRLGMLDNRENYWVDYQFVKYFNDEPGVWSMVYIPDPVYVPLPPTALLFGSGLMGLAGWRLSRKV